MVNNRKNMLKRTTIPNKWFAIYNLMTSHLNDLSTTFLQRLLYLSIAEILHLQVLGEKNVVSIFVYHKETKGRNAWSLNALDESIFIFDNMV